MAGQTTTARPVEGRQTITTGEEGIIVRTVNRGMMGEREREREVCCGYVYERVVGALLV